MSQVMMLQTAQCFQSTKMLMSKPVRMAINNGRPPKLSINSKIYSANMGIRAKDWRNNYKFHFCTIAKAADHATSVEFEVRRCKPELVAPAEPTPRELKQLSDLDDQPILRGLVPIIAFYRYDPSMKGKDPVRVFREALAKALVFYYPFAGRLREGPAGRLSVDCTGEGILFVEADADVELTQFGDPPQPPFPCFEKLFYDVHGPGQGIVNSPLLLIQVTRLMCGGFIFTILFNHIMCDGIGIGQFLAAVGDITQGAHIPSLIPVWNRDILQARNPPRVTCVHHEFDKMEDSQVVTLNKTNMVDHSFFIGPSELQSIRKLVPQHVRSCSTTFEILTACLWRCHTIALQLNPKDEVRLSYVVSPRGKFKLSLPVGYYGNVLALPPIVSAAGKLCQTSIEYALELVKEVKKKVTKEYMQSLIDSIVLKGRPFYIPMRSLYISDVRGIRLRDVNFGWGKAAYAGPPKVESDGLIYMIGYKNHKGEDGILILLCLEAQTMERFKTELSNMLCDQ